MSIHGPTPEGTKALRAILAGLAAQTDIIRRLERVVSDDERKLKDAREKYQRLAAERDAQIRDSGCHATYVSDTRALWLMQELARQYEAELASLRNPGEPSR